MCYYWIEVFFNCIHRNHSLVLKVKLCSKWCQCDFGYNVIGLVMLAGIWTVFILLLRLSTVKCTLFYLCKLANVLIDLVCLFKKKSALVFVSQITSCNCIAVCCMYNGITIQNVLSCHCHLYAWQYMVFSDICAEFHNCHNSPWLWWKLHNHYLETQGFLILPQNSWLSCLTCYVGIVDMFPYWIW